jgi:hypothetical protein
VLVVDLDRRTSRRPAPPSRCSPTAASDCFRPARSPPPGPA